MGPERCVNSTKFQMFAVSQPGIEQVTYREIGELGIDGRPVEGGVEFSGTLRELYLANLHLRTANRVLVRICTFRVTEFSELIKRLSRYPWELYGITPGLSNAPSIRVTCHKSKLYHSGAVAQRALAGIERRVGGFFSLKQDQTGPSPLIIIRIVRDRCTVSVDSSGEPLYKRGYRVRGTRAPIRENLAAALVLLSDWRVSMPLFDPFCGSGTIAIEAALIARGIAPGLNRDFAFRDWKNFHNELYQELCARVTPSQRESGVKIYASDRDEKAVETALLNARTAGVEESIQFDTRRFGDRTVPPCSDSGWIVTNPPYGRRLSKNVKPGRDIYRNISDAIKGNFQGWNMACLVPAGRKVLLPGIDARILATFSNSGFRVHAVGYCPEPSSCA